MYILVLVLYIINIHTMMDKYTILILVKCKVLTNVNVKKWYLETGVLHIYAKRKLDKREVINIYKKSEEKNFKRGDDASV